jgi:hypothetical protein
MRSPIRAPKILAFLLPVVYLIPAHEIEAQTPPYPVLESSYTQELFAAGATTSSYGGVAFGPNGNIWVKLCDSSVSLIEFDSAQTTTVNGSAVHPQDPASPFATAFACGLTNHPDGHLYLNTPNGIMKIDPNTGTVLGTAGPVGDSYGIAVDPQSENIVYPGTGCGNGSSGCTIVTYNPATGASQTLGTFSLPVPFEDVDGLSMDPTGNFIIVAGRTGTFPHDTPYLALLSRNASMIQQLPATHFPDGMAFHTNPFYMVANNNDGSITRYDFPQDDMTQLPVVSVIASGGFRGDLTGVGPDGCFYATQNQTRYGDGTVTKDNSVIRVCSTTGKFVQAGELVTVSSATHFVPVTPCRIADTRNPNGPFGGPAVAGGTSRDFVIPDSTCGIPATAAGYSMNVAVVPQKTLGYITLWPSGQSQPLVATLNSVDGRIKSNAAIVPAGANGAVSVFSTDTTDVILDINGYFVAGNSPSALAFYPVTPCRVADTRNAAGALGGPSLVPQSARAFPVLDSSCGLPADAQAYSLNFAAVPKGPLGYITVWPTGLEQPLVASLNDLTGTVAANAVVVPAGSNGAVSVFTTNATDLVIDTNGYFAPQGTGGLALYTMTPCRVLDTRLPAGSPPFSTTLNVNVTSSPCNVPATAQAFVFNATVIPPGPLGYITMWAQGQPQPLAATLNAIDGAITNNMAIVPTKNGSISVFPSGPTQLVLDLFGYFAP